MRFLKPIVCFAQHQYEFNSNLFFFLLFSLITLATPTITLNDEIKCLRKICLPRIATLKKREQYNCGFNYNIYKVLMKISFQLFHSLFLSSFSHFIKLRLIPTKLLYCCEVLCGCLWTSYLWIFVISVYDNRQL